MGVSKTNPEQVYSIRGLWSKCGRRGAATG